MSMVRTREEEEGEIRKTMREETLLFSFPENNVGFSHLQNPQKGKERDTHKKEEIKQFSIKLNG